MDPPLTSEGLIEHLIIVGPGRGVSFLNSRRDSGDQARSSQGNRLGSLPLSGSWHNISRPVPTVLKRFSAAGSRDLVYDVAYFCQPDGCLVSLPEPQTHVFFLTDTETNIRTYGVCLSLPHLFDPELSDSLCDLPDSDNCCIQEWGVLSLCLLSRHPFFSFFSHALHSLAHFVADFCGEELSWNRLLRAQDGAGILHDTVLGRILGKDQSSRRVIAELVRWIENLLSLRAPVAGESAVEVELAVDPAVTICYPPPNRLPLLDLPVCEVFRRLGVCTVIEIYKLVLSEHKVVLHSKDVSFTSHCVFVFVALLYPIQYLFPVIPLLPASMPTAENLLMAPTPFFIGVSSSFLGKLREYHRAELWVVDLDTRELAPPSQPDHDLLEFPYCILQLQADIRRALDRINIPPNPPSSSSSKPTNPSTHLFENDQHDTKESEADVAIRVAFIDFLFSPEVLGAIDDHLCIYRLFPRPVVTLRLSSFLSCYEKACPTVDTQFVRSLVRTQGVDYFFEWSLNPTNSAFEEVRRGVRELDRLSDHQTFHLHRSGVAVHQACLYEPNDHSLLYQEMLSYKANQASFVLVHPRDSLLDDSDSDFEYLSGDYADGASLPRSERSSSFYSDEEPEFPAHQHAVRSLFVALQREEEEEEEDEEEEEGRSSVVDQDTSRPLPDRHFSPSTPGGKYLTPKTPCDFVFPAHTDSPSHDQTSVASEFEISADGVGAGDGDHSEATVSGVRVSALTESARYDYPEKSACHTSNGLRPASSYDAIPVSDRSGPDEEEEDGGPTADAQPTGGQKFSTPNSTDDLRFTFPDTPPTGPHNPSMRRVHSEDSIVAAARRLLHATPQDQRPYLSPGTTSTDRIEFFTPPSTLRRTRASGPPKGLGGEMATPPLPARAIPSAAATRSHALDAQVNELVARLLDGQGLPWPKPPYLKQVASQERARVLALRMLETRLGVRRPTDTVMATSTQMRPVGVAKSVYKGLLELFRLFLQAVEEELKKEAEAAIFSVFLLLRLSFLLYLLPRRSPHPLVASRSTLEPLILPWTALAALMVTSESVGAESNQLDRTSGGGSPRRLSLEAAMSGGPVGQEVGVAVGEVNDRCEGVARSEGLSPEEDAKSVGGGAEGGSVNGDSSSSPDCTDGEQVVPTVEILVDDMSESNTTPTQTPALVPDSNLEPNLDDRAPQYHSPLPDRSESNPISIPPSQSSPSSTPSPTPRGGDRLEGRIASPLASRSPYLLQFLHSGPQDSVAHSPLYQDLMRALGAGRAFMTQQPFWAALFMSVLDVDRSLLGWNEKTSELYERYNSLSQSHRQAFGLEEDTLLSLLLHNLLVFMLAVGLHTHKTTSFIHRLSARARLAIMEERLLQQTLLHVEEKSSSDQSQLDLSDLGVVAMYSEVYPTVSYIVHYGINMVAPVYKLQVTKEVLILRRFPDEKLSSRLWNDCIVELSSNAKRETVSVKYHDSHGEFKHHFHSKQFVMLFDSMQLLMFGNCIE